MGALFLQTPMPRLGLSLVLVASLAVLHQGVTPSFSSDDYSHLERSIHYPGLSEALDVFVEPNGREYRPLVRLSLWFDHQLGDSAIPYKATNVLLHLVCTVLLYGLIRRLGAAVGISLVATLLFAVHPIHTTSVHFVLGRTDLIAALFYLSCLLSVARWPAVPAVWQIAVSLSAFLAALCSKELAITLPVMMLAVRVHHQRPSALGPWLAREQRWLWPFGLLVLAYLTGRWWLWRDSGDDISVYANLSPFNVANNYVEWGFGLLYPFDLYQAREWQQRYTGAFLTAAALASCGLLSFAAWLLAPNLKALLRSRLAWLGLLWIVITLAPMAGGSAHRWYLYLPSAGLSVLLAAAWQCLPPRKHGIAALAVTPIVLVCAVETARQSRVWRTQSDISRAILADIRTQGIHELDEIYLANQPFGYRSSFLFSFSSLEEAMRVELGRSPRVRVLSYVNLDGSRSLSPTLRGSELHFRTRPNAFQYLMLSATERRFSDLEVRRVGEVTLAIDELDAAGRITHYHLDVSEITDEPLYFFDGRGIRSLDALRGRSERAE